MTPVAKNGLLLGVILVSSLVVSGQTFTHYLDDEESIVVDVEAGKVFQFLYFNQMEDDELEISIIGEEDPFELFSSSSVSKMTSLVIAGPRQLKIYFEGYDKGMVSYKIKSNENSPAMVPSTAVVIPEDTMGGVEIVLESSTDLVNWTRANPGVYGSSEQKRFFRVRAIQQ